MMCEMPVVHFFLLLHALYENSEVDDVVDVLMLFACL